MAFLIKLLQTTGLNRSCFSLFKIKKQKQKTGWAVVVHAFNLSAWEAEAGRFLCYGSPSLYRVSNNQKRKKKGREKKKRKGKEGKKRKGKERKGKERKGKERKGKAESGFYRFEDSRVYKLCPRPPEDLLCLPLPSPQQETESYSQHYPKLKKKQNKTKKKTKNQKTKLKHFIRRLVSTEL